MREATTIRRVVEAYNLSVTSENKIHDDAVAKRFGFEGGLVPGVEVYAYMINSVISHFGAEWLERGSARCRFNKPIYDGHEAVVTAEAQTDEKLALKVESDGTICATGSAWMQNSQVEICIDDYPLATLPEYETRPDANPATLPDGLILGTFEQTMAPEEQMRYLTDVGETLAIFENETIVHPGWILRMANRALSHNVRLGPWIHVGSTIHNLSLPRYGDHLMARAKVVRNYEHKAHLFIDLDVLIAREDGTGLIQIDHTAIYRPRQVSEAA